MKVYYGFTKLTKKVVRKPEIAIYFENANFNPLQNQQWIERRIKIIYVREQTKEELPPPHPDIFDEKACKEYNGPNRMFTKYGYQVEEKPYFGNLDKVLTDNFNADAEHVSEQERKLIREKLRKEYYKFYNLTPKPQQLSFF